jgi:UDP-3-O-[3-hydroxymyristoyl] N-acetylglucosamine deacetylase/3-hydroxyacyl-[acyl-carrier-protein] dehydratase
VPAMQRTIQKPASYSGTGLHTGEKCTLTFEPAPPGSGVVFVRRDLPEAPEIKADIAHVVDTARGTTLGIDGARVVTVEHVLAAVAGLGIDNLTVEMDGQEAPVADGSALPFVQVLQRAGIVEQDRERVPFRIPRPVSCHRGDVDLVALPYNGLRISFLIEYDHPALRSQYASFEVIDTVFGRELAPARTFTFMHEVEALRQQGLIKGGSLENALVFGDEGVLNQGALRFRDEPVRHKIVDLLGDLFLLGAHLEGHVVATRSGHAANVALVKKLRRELEKQRRDGHRTGDTHVLDIDDIARMMPHRYPFLLVDRILEMESGKRVIGIKNVTVNEPFFQGHFPGLPIMPAVMIVEAMAQVGGILLLEALHETGRKLVYFTGIDRARFRRPVRPGDQVRFEVVKTRSKGWTHKMQGRGFVGDELVAEADLLVTMVEADLP